MLRRCKRNVSRELKSVGMETKRIHAGSMIKVRKRAACVFQVLPPRSPDLTPPEFFFWGYIKNAVYIPCSPTTLPDLAGRIQVATVTATPAMLTNVWSELE